MNVTILNLTPQALNVYRVEDTTNGVLNEGAVPFMTIEPEAVPCRCAMTSERATDINGVPVFYTSYGEVENLSKPKELTFYVVSAIAAASARKDGRHDVMTVSGPVRNDKGQVVGCLGFAFPA